MPECRIEALALARQPLNEIEAMLALTSVTSASSSTSSSTSTRGSLSARACDIRRRCGLPGRERPPPFPQHSL